MQFCKCFWKNSNSRLFILIWFPSIGHSPEKQMKQNQFHILRNRKVREAGQVSLKIKWKIRCGNETVCQGIPGHRIMKIYSAYIRVFSTNARRSYCAHWIMAIHHTFGFADSLQLLLIHIFTRKLISRVCYKRQPCKFLQPCFLIHTRTNAEIIFAVCFSNFMKIKFESPG